MSVRSSSPVTARCAELEKWKREKERKFREQEFAEARALIALAESTFAKETPSSCEAKKKQITKLTQEIEELVRFNEIVPLVIEVQQKVDARQRLLDKAWVPTEDQSAKINELWEKMKGHLKLKDVAVLSGDDLGQSLDLAASASIPDLGNILAFVEDFEKLKIKHEKNRKNAEKLKSLMAKQVGTSRRLKFLEDALELHRMLREENQKSL